MFTTHKRGNNTRTVQICNGQPFQLLPLWLSHTLPQHNQMRHKTPIIPSPSTPIHPSPSHLKRTSPTSIKDTAEAQFKRRCTSSNTPWSSIPPITVIAWMLFGQNAQILLWTWPVWTESRMADLYTPFRNYVKKMLTFQGREKGTAKVLILDNDTVFTSPLVAWFCVDTVHFGCFFPERDFGLRWYFYCAFRLIA